MQQHKWHDTIQTPLDCVPSEVNRVNVEHMSGESRPKQRSIVLPQTSPSIQPPCHATSVHALFIFLVLTWSDCHHDVKRERLARIASAELGPRAAWHRAQTFFHHDTRGGRSRGNRTQDKETTQHGGVRSWNGRVCAKFASFGRVQLQLFFKACMVRHLA
jgi:hypothetical protein